MSFSKVKLYKFASAHQGGSRFVFGVEYVPASDYEALGRRAAYYKAASDKLIELLKAA
jgi:hypothetical protein